jgi:hypothetical protein
MPIRPFLADQVFMPEQIAEMSAALESVCGTLNLDPVDDSRTRLVAKTIIAFAQRGVPDAAALTAATLKEFKAD